MDGIDNSEGFGIKKNIIILFNRLEAFNPVRLTESACP